MLVGSMRSALVLILLVASAVRAQYVATAQQGVSYPALTTATLVPLTAPGTNDPRDRGRATVPLGFTFPFYGSTYSSLTVTANGLAFLEPSTGAATDNDFPSNVALPSGAEPNAVLAVLWDDLIGNNTTIALRSQSLSGPNGAGLAIEWRDWNRVFGQFSLTFQLRVWSNGLVEFFYGPLTGSGATALTATVGIEAPSGTVGVNGLASCTTTCAISSFDPASTGTPISYVRFGPAAGVDLQPTRVAVNAIVSAGPNLDVTTALSLRKLRHASQRPLHVAVVALTRPHRRRHRPGLDADAARPSLAGPARDHHRRGHFNGATPQQRRLVRAGPARRTQRGRRDQ